MDYSETLWATQEPVVDVDEDYDYTDDDLINDNYIFITEKHRWTLPIEKEGDDYLDKVEFYAKDWHPGTIITINVPECPRCGDEAPWGPDIGMNCDCGFDWKEWWEKKYAD